MINTNMCVGHTCGCPTYTRHGRVQRQVRIMSYPQNKAIMIQGTPCCLVRSKHGWNCTSLTCLEDTDCWTQLIGAGKFLVFMLGAESDATCKAVQLWSFFMDSSMPHSWLWPKQIGQSRGICAQHAHFASPLRSITWLCITLKGEWYVAEQNILYRKPSHTKNAAPSSPRKNMLNSSWTCFNTWMHNLHMLQVSGQVCFEEWFWYED